MLRVEEALTPLEWIRELPSLENFISILQKCRKSKNLVLAKCVYIQICNHGMEAHEAIRNYIVPMFVECGSILYAQQVFDSSVHPNEYSWTSLIQGYSQCEEPWHTFDLFEKMQENCAHPSKYTFLALLKACARLRCMDKGREIHAHITKRGLDRDAYVCNTLVHMYAKCGSLLEAQGVFNKLLVRDVVSWNVILAGYAEHGVCEEALNCLKRLQMEGIFPDVVTFVCCLKACSSIRTLHTCREIHAQIAEEGFEKDPFVSSALLDIYAKCGSIAESQEVFEDQLVPDVILWNTLISGYAEHGLSQECLNCLEQMQLEGVPANLVTIVCSLKACGSIGARDRGQELHAEIVKGGFENDPFVCSKLVDMYTKCGSLAEAQEVFDLLPVQDVVSWTALLEGYAERGLFKEVLNGAQRMQLEGKSPNSVTFSCSLKACAGIGAMEKGREMHFEIAKEGFERDAFLGNALMDMYAKCGLLAEAQGVFDKLVARNIVSWNTLLAKYVEHGLHEESMKGLEQMQLENVPPNPVTFVWGLKSCDRVLSIDMGREMHSQVSQARFERDPFVCSILLHLYAKCGLLAEAQEIFDKLPAQGVVLWTALIAGYVEHGLGEEVLDCWERMQLDDVAPNAVTFICILKACSFIGSIGRGREIHMDIAKEGFEKDPVVGRALMGMYGKCGSLAEVWEVFDQLPIRNVVSWTALIVGYMKCSFGEEALNCLEKVQLEGLPLDTVTVVCGLKACGSIGDIERGRAIHAESVKEGIERENFVGTTLVDLYAKCGSIAEAHEVFDKLLVQDVVMWNTIIAAYIESQLAEEVLNCLEQMELHGVSPDAVTFVSILKACGSIGTIKMGCKIHAEILKEGYENDSFICNALVNMYASCGSIAEAQEVFEDLPTKNVVAWNALVAVYAEYGLDGEALNCLKQMQQEGVSPNAVTFVCCLKACGIIGAITRGREIHARIATQTREEACAQIRRVDGPDNSGLILPNAVIGMYGKCGSMIEARKVFDAMPTRDLVTWNTLIAGYAQQGESKLVFHVLETMREEGIQVDGITFLSVLNVCSHVGFVYKGQKYFKAMCKEYGISPTIEHYTILVDLLGRAGQLYEAEGMLERMPFQPDLVVWMTMLGACHKWNHVELGRHAFECAVRSDENHPAAYILMSNISVDAHIWEVSKERKEMPCVHVRS